MGPCAIGDSRTTGTDYRGCCPRFVECRPGSRPVVSGMPSPSLRSERAGHGWIRPRCPAQRSSGAAAAWGRADPGAARTRTVGPSWPPQGGHARRDSGTACAPSGHAKGTAASGPQTGEATSPQVLTARREPPAYLPGEPGERPVHPARAAASARAANLIERYSNERREPHGGESSRAVAPGLQRRPRGAYGASSRARSAARVANTKWSRRWTRPLARSSEIASSTIRRALSGSTEARPYIRDSSSACSSPGSWSIRMSRMSAVASAGSGTPRFYRDVMSQVYSDAIVV